MLSYDDLPEDNADLRHVSVQFPFLDQNSADACSSLLGDLQEYLSMEAPEIPEKNRRSLDFMRTAKVLEKSYWVWRGYDGDGLECFVAIEKDDDGSISMTYFANDYGLSVEQFLVGEYHGVL